MKKSDLLSSSLIVNFQNELALLIKNVVRHNSSDILHHHISMLHYAFHDDNFAYLVLDFLPGGDLLGLLGKFDSFSEDMSRLYVAELIIAIESVHSLGYAHMDIQTENILIGENGHLVLADFGSTVVIDKYTGCAKRDQANKRTAGAPDYMAPELLESVETESANDISLSLCDWWSLGVVFYEMMVGETPFYSDSVLEIYKNIRDFERSLKIPESLALGSEGRDLMQSLLCGPEKRLGRGGVSELKAHPFFANMNWDSVCRSKAPFVPELASNMDLCVL